MKDFKTLSVWGKAHELTKKTYESTSAFPREELHGLTSQIATFIKKLRADG
ncbi:MAG: four helix bundle protein [Nitrospirae bacterium]|nr:four helix bundle protein [Nitrospirota bacterium]